MPETAREFYEKYLGRVIDYDGACDVQCVDGARCWMDYFLGSSIPCGGGWAEGYWTKDQSWFLSKGCLLITDASALRDGDLVVWPINSKGSHKKSHVAMFYQGKEFGQNQGGNRGFCLKATDFSDMLGAYRAPTCVQEPCRPSPSGERVDQILHVGSHVIFPGRMEVTEINKEKNWALIPELGGWISAKPCDEVDATDGSCDQILHVGSIVTIKGVFEVTAVNKEINAVQLKAYSGTTSDWLFDFWIKAKPLTEVE